MLISLYERLANDPTDTASLWYLLYASSYDERVYHVVAQRPEVVAAIGEMLPCPAAAHFLSRGIVYDVYNVEVMGKFIKICSLLSRYEGVEQGATLSALLGSCGWPDENRMQLFNFSETYRHLAIQRSYFPQRGMLKLLAYIFCDDVLDDAVASLQNKTDILNHVNNIFVKTKDFVSWRFSVRVMSLAGGFNEDRIDVDDTETLTRVVTKSVPEFFTYFSIAFAYGLLRHYPQRVRGIVPKWLRRHRAMATGLVCGALGVFTNSLLEHRLHRERLRYELLKSQEMRRRRGAARRGTDYAENPYFDSLAGPTRRLFAIQTQTYAIAAGVLVATCLPLAPIKFPAWMGDVPFRFPTIPRLFPALLGMPTSSRCLFPYVVAPFALTSIANGATWGVSLYDRLVERQQCIFARKHGDSEGF